MCREKLKLISALIIAMLTLYKGNKNKARLLECPFPAAELNKTDSEWQKTLKLPLETIIFHSIPLPECSNGNEF